MCETETYRYGTFEYWRAVTGSLRTQVDALTTQNNRLAIESLGLSTRLQKAGAQIDALTKEVAHWRSRPDALRADKAEARAIAAEQRCAELENAVLKLVDVRALIREK